MGRSIANLHHCLSSCQGGDVGDQHRFATLRFTRLSRFWPTDHVKRGGTGWDLVSCAARWETQTETYDNIDLITHSHITINQDQSTWCQKIYSDTDWQSILKSTVCICMRSFNSSCLLSFSEADGRRTLWAWRWVASLAILAAQHWQWRSQFPSVDLPHRSDMRIQGTSPVHPAFFLGPNKGNAMGLS